MSRVGLVIPAFRPDPDVLCAYVRALRRHLASVTVRIELDDPDPAVCDRLDGLPARVRAVPERRGKGAAIAAGFDALETPVLAFVDADGSTPPAQVERVLAPVLTGRTALAVGSRRHPAATVRTHQSIGRRYLGDAFAWLARRLLAVDLHDYQCGAKAITADAWASVRPHVSRSGFAWDVDLLATAAALDHAVTEVPIEWHDRPGSSVPPVRTALELAAGLVAARRSARRLVAGGAVATPVGDD